MNRFTLLCSFLFCSLFSFAQFSDTSQLNTFIRDTIRDRRPEKVTAAQVQKGLLGISKFLVPNPVSEEMVNSKISESLNNITLQSILNNGASYNGTNSLSINVQTLIGWEGLYMGLSNSVTGLGRSINISGEEYGFMIYDEISSRGMTYGADYSGNMTSINSIPSVKKVLNLISENDQKNKIETSTKTLNDTRTEIARFATGDVNSMALWDVEILFYTLDNGFKRSAVQKYHFLQNTYSTSEPFEPMLIYTSSSIMLESVFVEFEKAGSYVSLYVTGLPGREITWYVNARKTQRPLYNL